LTHYEFLDNKTIQVLLGGHSNVADIYDYGKAIPVKARRFPGV